MRNCEFPQFVVPSLVWLEGRDHVSSGKRDALVYSLKCGFKVEPMLGYDEVIALGDVLSVRLDELTPQQVKRGTEIVDDIAGDGCQASWRSRSKLDPILQVSRIGLYLADDLIGFVSWNRLIAVSNSRTCSSARSTFRRGPRSLSWATGEASHDFVSPNAPEENTEGAAASRLAAPG
jgi:hypothetical protein